MRKSSKFIVAAVALALGTGVAVALVAPGDAAARGWGAYGHGGHMGAMGPGGRMARGAMVDRLFELADRDGDGTLTREELQAAIAERVSEYDRTGDGTLTLEEFEGLFLEIVRPGMVRAFQHLDRDGSGTIEAADIERPLARVFDRLDRQGSGEISRDRMRRMERGHGPRWRGDRHENRRGERGGMRRGAGGDTGIEGGN